MKRILVSVAVFLVAAVQSVHAEDNPLDARFVFNAGWFFLSTDTRVRVDGETSQSVGSDIDFDSTFGVDDVDRFRFDGMWRIAKKHAIRALFFENNRSGTRDMTRDISFGDEVFPIGATVTARSEFSVAELSYDYAFIQRDNYELAGGIGLHMLDMGLNLEGTVTGGGGSQSGTLTQEASTKAPLPVLGVRGLWRISDKFYASAQVQYFYVEFDAYKGALTDLTGQIVWQVVPHFGVGVGYNSFRLNVDVDDGGRFEGRLRLGYGGAMVFATAQF